MKQSHTRRAAQLAVLIATIATSATAQSDTTRAAQDSVRRADSLRQVDSASKQTRPDSPAVKVGSPTKSNRAKGYQPDPDIPAVDGPVRLVADLSDKTLTIFSGDNAIKTFNVAVGTESKPTPPGRYTIRKIVWNPSWIPPDQPWAKGKTAKGPGEAGNPMKVAKIFFREPDFYIHGTGDIKSLGSADSHGCIRMHPDEVASLAKFLMEHGGNAQEEGWFSRVIHLRWQTHTVELPSPISLTINQ